MDLASIRERVEALTGFTEGPWKMVTDLPALAIMAKGGHRIVQTPNQNNYQHFGRSDRWLGVSSMANASLIAAAPDLHGYVLPLLDALAAAEARERAAVEAAKRDDREGLEAVIDQMAAAMADRLIARNREGEE